MSTRPKLLVLAFLAAALLVAGCTGSGEPVEETDSGAPLEVIADYPDYESLADAIASTELIVAGNPIDSRTELMYPSVDKNSDPKRDPQAGAELSQEELDARAIITTVTTFEVSTVLMGETEPGTIIEVQQLVGTLDGVIRMDANAVQLDSLTGKDVILLLTRVTDDGYLRPIHPIQGLLVLDDDRLMSPSSTGQLFEGTEDLTLSALVAEIGGN